jgi:hypothetical protein
MWDIPDRELVASLSSRFSVPTELNGAHLASGITRAGYQEIVRLAEVERNPNAREMLANPGFQTILSDRIARGIYN